MEEEKREELMQREQTLMDKEQRELIEEKDLDEVDYRFNDSFISVQQWLIFAVFMGIIVGATLVSLVMMR